jgi:hypothetical protein
MKKIFDKLFFSGPMSLGDSFVCTGIVHYYGDRSDELHLPVLPKFYKTLSTLYQDHTHIKVIPLDPYDLGENQYVSDNKLSRIHRADLINTNINGVEITAMWDIQVYANYELPYSLRYSNFRLPKFIHGSRELFQNLSKNEPYILFHRFSNDFPKGAPIDITAFRQVNGFSDIKIIEITESITDNMMEYVELIKNAEEIHCIPSSFHCLVDGIETPAKLFFHDIREKTSMAVNSIWNNHRWTMVNYNPRL